MMAALMIWLIGFLFLAGRTAISSVKIDRPLTSLAAGIKEERQTLSKAFGYALLLGLAMALHGWAKTMIPSVGGYWADPMRYRLSLHPAEFGRVQVPEQEH